MTRQLCTRGTSRWMALAGVLSTGVVACQTEDSSPVPLVAEDIASLQQSCGQADYIERIINRGAELHTANGIMAGPSDTLFVASVLDRSITELDPHSGQILRRLGPEQGVETPDDLVFGPDGSLYFTAFFTGQVGKLSPEGVRTTLATLGAGVNAITVSNDGQHLYVSRVFLGDELYDVDLTGASAPRLIASNLGGFNGMDMGPDGYLYGPLWFPGKVARVDVQTGQMTIVAEGFHTPAAVKFDHQGRLYVIDQEAAEVVRVDVATGTKETVATLEIGIDNLTFDSDDRLFVSNAHDGSVHRVFPSGHAIAIQRGGLTSPGGVALALHDGKLRLFVSDTYTLRELHPWTGFELSAVHGVLARPGLTTPLSLSSYGNNLVSTSWFGKVVQVWDPNAGLVATHRDFPVPIFATGFGSDLIISELTSHCVWKRPQGTTDKIALACGLPVPTGLAGDGTDLFAAEWALGKVVQVVDNGVTLAQPRTVVSGLVHPEGLAMTPEGMLLVVETGTQKLLQVDPATGETATVTEGLQVALPATPGYPPTWVFNGVTVDPCGVIYVTEDNGSAVTQIIPTKAHVFSCLAHADW